MSFEFLNQLPTPADIKRDYPLSPELRELKKHRDLMISDVITGKDSRVLVIIGPCSADNEDSVCDYVSRLTKIQEDVKDQVILVPRIYTNKPRTTGEGYKGIASQPDPEKAPDMIEGLIAMRKMHIRAIEESGLTCADEMLYPENWGYVEDLLSYVAIGARSVEDQQHRLTASGVGIPVGMKNPTGGDLSVMMNSITAAQGQHVFLYRGWEVQSLGNPYAHALLRGYVDKHGKTYSNYHYEDCFAGCTTGRNDVRCSGQRFFDIRSISKVDTFEAAVVQFFCHPFQSGSKRIIQTNIRSEFHHHGSLSHIGANHSGCSYNCKFLVG